MGSSWCIEDRFKRFGINEREVNSFEAFCRKMKRQSSAADDALLAGGVTRPKCFSCGKCSFFL
jgi:hypothetical protein